MKGGHKSEEIKAIKPPVYNRIPFITVDGEPLVENAAILRFLALEHPSLNQFYPAGDNKLRAKIDAALDWCGTSYSKAMILI